MLWQPKFFTGSQKETFSGQMATEGKKLTWMVLHVITQALRFGNRSISLCFQDGDRLNPVYGNPNLGKRVHVHSGSTFQASKNELLSSVETSNSQFDPTMRDSTLELLSKPAATRFEVKRTVNLL